MQSSPNRSCCLLVLVVIACGFATAKTQARDWPQWRGPDRDGKSADTGLLQAWPAAGPALAWKAAGLGKGYAGIAAVGDRLFTMGDKEDAGYVIALSAADGRILWSTKAGAAGTPDPPGWSFPGPRCTPTVSGDLVFALNAWGEMVCVNAADGKELWRKDFRKDFGGKPPTWGFSESPLVDGDQVVITPGGSRGAMVALDKKTGRVLWQSQDFTDDAHYSSIIPAEIGGVRQYVQLTAASVAAKWFLPEPDAAAALRLLDGRHRLAAPDLIRAETGNLVWKLQVRGVLDAQEATDLIEHFLSLPLEIYDSTYLVAPALQIAIATRRTVYDSLYLALAVELGGTVVTADARWVNALTDSPFAPFLRPLGQR
ncbi:MAG: PIN domain-containing protein [Planctomycetes bacterium]|nr:PIN domain-containing protein [Planctomycetota bacterium]